MKIKEILLFTCCILVPIVPYFFSRKIKRGISIQIITFSITLLGVYFILYSIGRYAVYPQDLEYYFFGGMSLIFAIGGLSIYDSIKTLNNFLNLKKEVK